jgi:hypothetical protein
MVSSLGFYNGALSEGDHFAAVTSAAVKHGGILKSVTALRFPRARNIHYKDRYVMPWEHKIKFAGDSTRDVFFNADIKAVSASIDFVFESHICKAELGFSSVSSDSADHNPLELIFDAYDVKLDTAGHGWQAGAETRAKLLELFKAICDSTAPLYAAILVENTLRAPIDLERTDASLFTDFFVIPELIEGLDMTLLTGDDYSDPIIRWKDGYFISMWLLHGYDKRKSAAERRFASILVEKIKYLYGNGGTA